MNQRTISDVIKETADNTKTFLYTLAAHIEELEAKVANLETTLQELSSSEIDDHK